MMAFGTLNAFSVLFILLSYFFILIQSLRFLWEACVSWSRFPLLLTCYPRLRLDVFFFEVAAA